MALLDWVHECMHVHTGASKTRRLTRMIDCASIGNDAAEWAASRANNQVKIGIDVFVKAVEMQHKGPSSAQGGVSKTN